MLASQLSSSDLKADHRYNEVLLDAGAFARALPWAVEALFFVDGTASDSACHCAWPAIESAMAWPRRNVQSSTLDAERSGQ